MAGIVCKSMINGMLAWEKVAIVLNGHVFQSQAYFASTFVVAV